ncbi:MAG: hypothetical protein J7M39_09215 [Anaerolineae bacterium]|nr:hypothetical protein [Anaerolineae bacterium]
MKVDDVTQVDQRLWDRLVEEGCGFALPWLWYFVWLFLAALREAIFALGRAAL